MFSVSLQVIGNKFCTEQRCACPDWPSTQQEFKQGDLGGGLRQKGLGSYVGLFRFSRMEWSPKATSGEARNEMRAWEVGSDFTDLAWPARGLGAGSWALALRDTTESLLHPPAPRHPTLSLSFQGQPHSSSHVISLLSRSPETTCFMAKTFLSSFVQHYLLNFFPYRKHFSGHW